MFDTVEKYRGFFKILLVLIALSFVTFTAHSFTQAGGDFITRIGDQTVTTRDVERVIRNKDLPSDAAARQQVYDLLAQQAYLIDGAQSMGMSLSDQQVKNLIRQHTGFQENGVFSEALYRQYLQRINQSEGDFVDSLKKDHYLQNISILLGSGAPVTDSQAEAAFKMTESVREVQTVMFAPQQYMARVTADDAAVEQFYRQNPQRYVQQQAVKFDYVRVAAVDLADAQEVSEEEVRAALAGGTDGDAAAVKKRLQTEKAARLIPVIKENMIDAAINHSDDLQGVAKEAGVKVVRHGEWLERNRAQPDGLPPAVREALFSDEVLKQGFNSDAIDADGAVWVVRVNEVRPEKTMPLRDIKDMVKQDYIAAQAATLAKKAADETLAQLQKGEHPALNWSSPEKLNARQVNAVLPPADAQKLLQLKPQDGKAAYMLAAGTPMPILMRVNALSTPEISPELLAQSKTQLAQQAGDAILQNYLRYLQRTVKSKAGQQKLNEE